MINFLINMCTGIGASILIIMIIGIILTISTRWYKKRIKKENVDKLVTLKEIMLASRTIWDQIIYNRSHTERMDTSTILEYIHQIGLINISWQHIQFIIDNPNIFETESIVLNWLIIQELQMKQQDLIHKQHSTLH